MYISHYNYVIALKLYEMSGILNAAVFSYPSVCFACKVWLQSHDTLQTTDFWSLHLVSSTSGPRGALG